MNDQGKKKAGLLRRFFRGAGGGLRTLTLTACVLAVFYWGFWASDRYVSQAQVFLQRADTAGGGGLDIAGLLGGATGVSQGDQMLLRSYLLSVDMLKILDARLHLRAHYSAPQWDLPSRMWFKDAPIEWFHRYFLSRVKVDYDDASGTLVVAVQAYDPETAQAIARSMVTEGGRYMNVLAQGLAREQVNFLSKEVDDLSQQVLEAHQALIAFQNAHGLVSPEATVQNLSALVAKLEGQLSELQTQLRVKRAYLSRSSPEITELNQRIAAVKAQLTHEKARLTSPKGRALNKVAEEYQLLQSRAEFAENIYKTALSSLQQGRIEAARTLKKVSVIQSPTLPEYPMEPRRIYNTAVFILLALIVSGVLHMLGAIVRDHKD